MSPKSPGISTAIISNLARLNSNAQAVNYTAPQRTSNEKSPLYISQRHYADALPIGWYVRRSEPEICMGDFCIL